MMILCFIKKSHSKITGVDRLSRTRKVCSTCRFPRLTSSAPCKLVNGKSLPEMTEHEASESTVIRSSYFRCICVLKCSCCVRCILLARCLVLSTPSPIFLVPPILGNCSHIPQLNIQYECGFYIDIKYVLVYHI